MKFVLLAIMAFSAVVALSTMSGNERVVQAAPIAFELRAVGAEEVPPVSGAGTAFGRFTFDEATRELTFAITISGVSGDAVIGSHFHRGFPGVNGPIIYPFLNGAFTQISGKLTIAAEDVELLKAGGFYWNNHTTVNPGGFARAQVIIPSAAPAAAPRVSPPSTGDAGLASEASSSAMPVVLAGLLMLGGLGMLVAIRRRA